MEKSALSMAVKMAEKWLAERRKAEGETRSESTLESVRYLEKDLREKTPKEVFEFWGHNVLPEVMRPLIDRDFKYTGEPTRAEEERANAMVKEALRMGYLSPKHRGSGEWEKLCGAAGCHGWTSMLEALTRDMSKEVKKEAVNLALNEVNEGPAAQGAHLNIFKWGFERGLVTKLQALLVSARPGAFEYLTSKGYDSSFEWHGWTQVHEACSKGDSELLKILIERGYPLDSVSKEWWRDGELHNMDTDEDTIKTPVRKDGLSPLSVAAFFGHVDVAMLLIEEGVDLSKGGDKAPLIMAIRGDEAKAVETLVSAGVSVYGAEEEGFDKSPMAWALRMGNTEVLQKLIDCGFDLHERGSEAMRFVLENEEFGLSTFSTLARGGVSLDEACLRYLSNMKDQNVRSEELDYLMEMTRSQIEARDLSEDLGEGGARLPRKRL